MTQAPRLSDSEVRTEVERIFRKDHRSKLVALFGRGDEGRFELGGERWEILPTTCELDLRAKLPRPGERPSPRVFLVDWREELPLDIQCRLAHGRLLHVARDARLQALFGARHIDPGIAASALARLLLSGVVEGLKGVPGLKLTRELAWTRFLAAKLELPDEAFGSAERLFAWARASGSGPAFVRQCEADELWRQVRRELHAWLGERLGPAGLLAFRAWETGQVERTLQVMVLAHGGDHGDDAYRRGLIEGQVGAWLPQLAVELRAAQSALAEGELLVKLVDPSRHEADLRLLREAEQLAVGAGVAAICATSGWLPAGRVAREQALAGALEAFVEEPSVERLASIREALERLNAHRLDAVERGKDHREGRLMAVRLCTWLLARKLKPPVSPHGTTWQPAVELAWRYAHEGGYFDWARAAVRGIRGASGPLEGALRRLLERLDAVASADDRQFAEAYVSWLEAGKPSADVVPIEGVVKRVVVPFLKGNDRKLLVVLMDGMSHTVAAQVLFRLQEERRWRPIKWRAQGGKEPLAVPPVLAAAPTLTDVSRAAFFAGKADPRFGDQGTDKDGARWAENAQLRELIGEVPATLFVRRDLTSGQELIPELKAAIAGDDRVVAVIVNAIDEQLKGSTQVAIDYSRVPVTPLDALLDAAAGGERAVLLVADHGHVRGDALRVLSGRVAGDREYGARWRGLLDGEQPEADEVRLPDTCWRPRRSAGVAVLWNTNVAFKAPHLGEHGGLSLMETVSPAILIGPEWGLDRAGPVEDPDLATRALPLPDWWELKSPRPPAAPRTVKPVESAQLPLIAVQPAAIADAPAETPQLIDALKASKAFREHVRGQPERELEQVLSWLSVLIRGGDALNAGDFARECGKLPHQVAGIVARMGILNADGFAIVEHDVAGRRVVLHKARLQQQYGVRQ